MCCQRRRQLSNLTQNSATVAAQPSSQPAARSRQKNLCIVVVTNPRTTTPARHLPGVPNRRYIKVGAASACSSRSTASLFLRSFRKLWSGSCRPDGVHCLPEIHSWASAVRISSRHRTPRCNVTQHRGQDRRRDCV